MVIVLALVVVVACLIVMAWARTRPSSRGSRERAREAYRRDVDAD